MDIAKIRKKAKEASEKEKGERQSAEGQGSAAAAPAAAPQAEPEEVREEPLEPADAPESWGPPEEAAPAPAAPEARETGEEPGIVELLTFALGREEFAFRVPEVEEIIRYQTITKVPTMPDYVCGITSLRGKIIPVIDLKKRLVLSAGDETGEETGAADEEYRMRNTKILILAGPRGLIGATIDRVIGVVRFPEGSVIDPPAHLTEEELMYVEGVVSLEGRFISIIRSEAALTIEVA
ncbi:MAG: chemotaxis protein CheW [Nitrospiraceae bacterium]|nr:chemotaxis protein CheW [Nitrospiraceae bacterium]